MSRPPRIGAVKPLPPETRPKVCSFCGQSDECVCGHTEAEHTGGLIGCEGCGECNGFRPAFIFWGRMDALVQANHDNALYVLAQHEIETLIQGACAMICDSCVRECMAIVKVNRRKGKGGTERTDGAR